MFYFSAISLQGADFAEICEFVPLIQLRLGGAAHVDLLQSAVGDWLLRACGCCAGLGPVVQVRLLEGVGLGCVFVLRGGHGDRRAAAGGVERAQGRRSLVGRGCTCGQVGAVAAGRVVHEPVAVRGGWLDADRRSEEALGGLAHDRIL